MPAPGRSSTRFCWTAHGGGGERTLTATRWIRRATSVSASTGRGCRNGFLAVSRTRSSTRSSPGCPLTVTGPWLPSTFPRARASELLSAWQGGVDPGRQLISVVRKGTGETQELPASTDAFVWLRLYQLELEDAIPNGRRLPLWWTLRNPSRPLTYHAAHRMFERANNKAGTAATLHALRHTAAYRMAEDPGLPLTDVQFVLGHAQLTTTQIYLTPRKEEVIRRLLAHHAEQTRQAAARTAPAAAPGYSAESLYVLFGTAR
jgi:hypothetical protein